MRFDPDKVTFFAKTDSRGKQIPFGIKAIDRTKHVYVIGKTGMGKSTLLENMAVQDIKNGEGFAFIDPHGQTAETLLDYIPEERKDDVVYFAPHDMDNPMSFNIMEDVDPDKRHLVVSGLMSVFEKIWEDQWSARMAYILQNTLMALLEYPDSTLLGVNRMLSDKNYRKLVVDNITDPAVRAFWTEEFAGYTDRFAAEATPAIQNKIGQFTGNPVIRNIIGQPKSSFDIRKMMDEKKIIIMNLSKGLIGETNANLLGSMLTTRIYLAAMSRADLTPREMETKPNFYFYVDEFQSFANATFSNILSEARKYKLNLTIAHQYISQMEDEVKDAVFGNVGTTISFRVGPFDAEVLETVFAPQFMATDIVNLGAYQIYLTLMIDGIGSQPFSAETLPPIEMPASSCRDMVIASSRRQFANPRTEVEAKVEEFHKPTPKPGQNNNNSQNSGARSSGGHSNPRITTQSQGDHKGGATVSGNKPSQGTNQTRNNYPSSQTNARTSQNSRVVSNNTHQGGGRTQSNSSSTSGNRGDGQRIDTQQQIRTHKSTTADIRPSTENNNRGRESDARISQSRENNGHRSPMVKQKRNNLEDLRSVLKGISKPEDTKEKSKPEEKKNSVDLKNAVAKAVEEEPKSPDAPALSQQAAVPKTQPAPNVATAEVLSVSSGQGKDVSAKELERMMRVTTADKPPL